MTEAEWLGTTRPDLMLDFLRAGEVSARKLRLFACGCCRRVWSLLADERSKTAVEVVEAYADGGATQQQLSMAQGGAGRALGYWDRRQCMTMTEEKIKALAATTSVHLAARPTKKHRTLAEAVKRASNYAASAERVAGVFSLDSCIFQCQIIRCMYGNPFRPAALDPAWLAWNGGTIGRLAELAYQERELPSGHLFAARLALVADALEDAGCGSAEILGHLRSAGPHVRGCWAVDLLLGRE